MLWHDTLAGKPTAERAASGVTFVLAAKRLGLGFVLAAAETR